jgi:SNF2 family DNA or RNA helicase/uncharacterized Zn finger protein
MAWGRKKRRQRSGWGWQYGSKPKIAEGSGIRGGGKYGLTWWGKAWLDAFTEISDDNRLPRGRTYANNGSVTTLSISENKVVSKVQGSYLYDVTIEIPKFTKKEIEMITEMVQNDPLLFSALINKTLPQDLHLACENLGIEIFPKNWKSFKSNCDCPDWASPCKHLAAVLYLVSSEIDKNPFLIFNLHGFDLLNAFQGVGTGTQMNGLHKIKSIGDITLERKKWKQPDFEQPSELVDTIDFSHIPPKVHLNTTRLLANSPIFWPKANFKERLEKELDGLSKKKSSWDASSEVISDKYRDAEIIEITCNPWGKPSAFSVWDVEHNVVLNTQDIGTFISWLQGTPAGRLSALPADLVSVFLACNFARSLVANGAVVPELIEYEDTYNIRWLPALAIPEIADLFQQFSGILSPGILEYELKTKSFLPLPEQAAVALLSMFISYEVNRVALPAKEYGDQILELFFEGKPTQFEKAYEKGYQNSIQIWLSRLFIAQSEYYPVFRIKEHNAHVFAMDLVFENRTNPTQVPIPLSQLFDPKWKGNKAQIFSDLTILCEYFPRLRNIVQSKGAQALTLSLKELSDILSETMPVLELFGVQFLLPKELKKLLRPQLSLTLSEKGTSKVATSSILDLSSILAYNYHIALGSHTLTEAEFKELLKQGVGLTKYKNEYIFIDPKLAETILERLAKGLQLSDHSLLQAALSGEYEGAGISITSSLKKRMDALTKVDLIPLPKTLQATLRLYQHRGYSWLCKNIQLGLGSILADDMGLGKTVQVIATMLHLKELSKLSPKSPALIIMPSTLLQNWKRELNRFAPNISVGIYHGTARDLAQTKDVEVILTSYSIARSDISQLDKRKWLISILDEAQQIKNPAAAQSKAVKKVKAEYRIAMSGTPVENRLSEYWSVFEYANAGLLGTGTQFKKEYATPIEADRNLQVLQRFQLVTKPFVLRRLKTDKTIITDLPDKIEQNQYCTMTPMQVSLYKAQVDEAMKKIEEANGINRKGMVLALMMALKQICNHPAQFLKKGNPDADQSGKCEHLLSLIDTAIGNDEKTIVFTQFREMGEILALIIAQHIGQKVPFLHGGVTLKNRTEMVDSFQENHRPSVFIISLKAGGTGLNLTSASQVIHYDLWWNPAVEAQATDRAFRIGQKKNVLVNRFITQGSFEEKIDALMQSKRELANLTVTSGETWIGDLSNADLRQVFSLDA